jgi:hypothetical protein
LQFIDNYNPSQAFYSCNKTTEELTKSKVNRKCYGELEIYALNLEEHTEIFRFNAILKNKIWEFERDQSHI